MNVAIPDSLAAYIQDRVRLGGYQSAGAFIADLVSAEAGAMEGVARGEPLPVNAQLDRRLAALLDEAMTGDYVDAGPDAFDEMEREARALVFPVERS